MSNIRQYAAPFIPTVSNTRGESAYSAATNVGDRLSDAQVGPNSPISFQLGTALTSRTGGRFRISATISGTTSVAGDAVSVQLAHTIQGVGPTLFGPVVTVKSGAATGEWSATIEALTPAVTAGQTLLPVVVVTELGAGTVTSPAGAAYIMAEELPA
jgi:hypothetical protein